MSDISMEFAVLAGVSFCFLVPHGVRPSERDLVFISQVDILLRLIELGIHFVYREVSFPFLLLSPINLGVIPFIFVSLRRVVPRGFLSCRIRRGRRKVSVRCCSYGLRGHIQS